MEEGLNAGKSAKELVKKFGMACPMPGSFQSSLVSIIGAKSYPEAIRETVMCGGDSCSRYSRGKKDKYPYNVSPMKMRSL